MRKNVTMMETIAKSTMAIAIATCMICVPAVHAEEDIDIGAPMAPITDESNGHAGTAGANKIMDEIRKTAELRESIKATGTAGANKMMADINESAEEKAEETIELLLAEEQRKKEEEEQRLLEERNTEWKVGFTQCDVHLRKERGMDAEIITTVPTNTELNYGILSSDMAGSEWVKTAFDGQEGYVHVDYVGDKKVELKLPSWNGPTLNSFVGSIHGPSGKETYYNLPMGYVITKTMNGSMSDYTVRADGVKTYKGYVMVAANLNVHPRGSLIPTTLGMGIVCDACESAYQYPGGAWIDIATTW